MSTRAFFTSVLLLTFSVVHSQEKYVIDWDFSGQSFEDFVLKAESKYPVKFFYNEEWIENLTLGSYGDRRLLNEILDSLFKGNSIYYYTGKSGNIILTKNFEIKTLEDKGVDSRNYIPGLDYSDSRETNSTSGTLWLI